MSNMDKHIMVVPRAALFSQKAFEGFMARGDYEQLILQHALYMRRGDAETDPTHKQPIAYVVLVNRKEKKVFAYRRAAQDANYSERRLQGKWSWGIGGHVDHTDGKDNPIRASMLRELDEEVAATVENISVLGYINSEADDVSRVHFGILYVVETSGSVEPTAAEIATGRMMSITEIELLASSANVESWSLIALGPLKDYLAA